MKCDVSLFTTTILFHETIKLFQLLKLNSNCDYLCSRGTATIDV